MAKSTALVTVDHSVPVGSELAKLEAELFEAVSGSWESFAHTGIVLKKILDKKAYRDAGYKDFDTYMNERMPVGIKASQAYRIMAATEVRARLPDVSPTGRDCWTERALRPLCHSDFSPSDHRRLGKKILTRVKRGERLTEKLVKQICDEDRGVPRKKKKKQAKALLEASLEANLPKVADMVVEFRVAFEMYEQDAWDEVEETNPQLIRRLITELDQLTSFLRGD